MSQDRLYQILRSPIVSEKSTRVADLHNQVVFEVIPDATKNEVQKAVELAFDVKVVSVQITNIRGKMKSTGRQTGKRKNWKKAYIRLEQGQEIDFTGVA